MTTAIPGSTGRGEGAPASDTVTVGLGEFRVTTSHGAVLSCLGLGSCVGLALYDPVAHVAGLAHFVLPTGGEGRADGGGARFVDTGLPRVVGEMERLGARRHLLVARLAGGAQVVLGARSLRVGERNVEAVIEGLKALAVPLRATHVGGDRGRTIRLYCATGRLTVSVVGGETLEI